jgi:hypothetical protein
VANPEYARWAGAQPGSSVLWRGYQIVRGSRTLLSVRVTLVARNEHRLFVEREFGTEGGIPVQTPLSGRFAIAAQIDPSEDPATAPQHERTELPPMELTIGGQTLLCGGYRLRAPGDFPQLGADVDATMFGHESIPGWLARLELKTNVHGEPFEFVADVVEYHAE